MLYRKIKQKGINAWFDDKDNDMKEWLPENITT